MAGCDICTDNDSVLQRIWYEHNLHTDDPLSGESAGGFVVVALGKILSSL